MANPIAEDIGAGLRGRLTRQGDDGPQVRQGLVAAPGAERLHRDLVGFGRERRISATLRRCALLGPPVGVGKEGRDGPQELEALVDAATRAYWQLTTELREEGASDEDEDSGCRANASAGRLS